MRVLGLDGLKQWFLIIFRQKYQGNSSERSITDGGAGGEEREEGEQEGRNCFAEEILNF